MTKNFRVTADIYVNAETLDHAMDIVARALLGRKDTRIKSFQFKKVLRLDE